MTFDSIPEAFQTKMRVAILAAIYNGEKDFNTLKEILKATDGNLSVQLSNLEKYGCISVQKNIVNKRNQTIYSISEEGRRLFSEYVEMLIKSTSDV